MSEEVGVGWRPTKQRLPGTAAKYGAAGKPDAQWAAFGKISYKKTLLRPNRPKQGLHVTGSYRP